MKRVCLFTDSGTEKCADSPGGNSTVGRRRRTLREPRAAAFGCFTCSPEETRRPPTKRHTSRKSGHQTAKTWVTRDKRRYLSTRSFLRVFLTGLQSPSTRLCVRNSSRSLGLSTLECVDRYDEERRTSQRGETESLKLFLFVFLCCRIRLSTLEWKGETYQSTTKVRDSASLLSHSCTFKRRRKDARGRYIFINHKN